MLFPIAKFRAYCCFCQIIVLGNELLSELHFCQMNFISFSNSYTPHFGSFSDIMSFNRTLPMSVWHSFFFYNLCTYTLLVSNAAYWFLFDTTTSVEVPKWCRIHCKISGTKLKMSYYFEPLVVHDRQTVKLLIWSDQTPAFMSSLIAWQTDVTVILKKDGLCSK